MTTLDDWTRLAAEIRPRSEIFIDGTYRAARSGATFDSINPATGELLARVASADAEDVDAAVASARAAFECGAWSRASAGHRKRVLQRLAELITAHGYEFALLDSLDMGKLVTEAHTVDVPSAADLFAFYGEAVDKINGEIAPTDPGSLALVTREPLGVVGAVTPWNFPLDLAVWKLAPALAAGNSVVTCTSADCFEAVAASIAACLPSTNTCSLSMSRCGTMPGLRRCKSLFTSSSSLACL